MISPQHRYVLLPQDREIMDITGMSEEEYRWFVKEAFKHSKIQPGTPVALGTVAVILIQLAIGALFTGISMLLAPKPKEETVPEIAESKVEGQDIIRRDKFTPKSGFDSIQNVVDMGSIAPIIYCKREGQKGGLRVNTNLLWSQMLSVGGGQFFKGLFFVGESAPELELSQTALGNNTLASYEMEVGADAGRITIYYRKDGGRIDTSDYELGVIPRNDPGAQAATGRDIYTALGGTHFCQAVLPSNQTEFGLSQIIGNNMGYKIGEDWLRLSQWQQRADTTRERQGSNQRIAEREKQSVRWTTRAGFVGTEGLKDAPKGSRWTYKIFKEFHGAVMRESGASSGGEPDAVVDCRDVDDTIIAMQRNYDERINIGDLYKIGSAIGICISRTEPFISNLDFDGAGRSVTAEFEILEPGKIHTWPETTLNIQEPKEYNAGDNGMGPNSIIGVLASEYSHCFRLSVGAFSVERPAIAIEVGFRSSLQVKSSGIANFNSLIAQTQVDGDKVPDNSYQAYVDAEYCGGLTDGGDTNGDTYRKDITPGKYSAADTRYSFFRISYRAIDEQQFTSLRDLYGVRCATGVNVYNYLRFRFPDSKRREFRIVPISSWEIRKGEARGNLYVMDAHLSDDFSVNDGELIIEGRGAQIPREQPQFQIKAFLSPSPIQLGMALKDDPENNNYVDGWARLAEDFIYDQVTASVSQPEHSIAYVNIISENEGVPDYKDLAVLGLDIRSSQELNTLDQLSVYCTRGVIDSHLFPEVLYDLLTNERYGVGEIFDEKQINKRSFNDAAAWTEKRGYYFDGAIADKINIRSWGAERAKDFLLDLGVSSGQFKIFPALNFDGPEPIAALFTSGNILEGSFQMTFLDAQERVEPIVTIKWRQERLQRGIAERGLFPQIREITLKRDGVPEGNPVIQLDISNFATNQRHAIDRAKYECQLRKYVTHAVKFKTVPVEAPLQVGSIIKVGMETLKYEQPRNGAIAKNGTVVSWPELGDGTYDVVLWDGKEVVERELRIVRGRAEPPGAVFCLASKTDRAEAYKIQSLGFDEDGMVDVEAISWPLDDNDRSLITKTFDDNEFVITGKISE